MKPKVTFTAAITGDASGNVCNAWTSKQVSGSSIWAEASAALAALGSSVNQFLDRFQAFDENNQWLIT